MFQCSTVRKARQSAGFGGSWPCLADEGMLEWPSYAVHLLSDGRSWEVLALDSDPSRPSWVKVVILNTGDPAGSGRAAGLGLWAPENRAA
jgi:hypothetical protein